MTTRLVQQAEQGANTHQLVPHREAGQPRAGWADKGTVPLCVGSPGVEQGWHVTAEPGFRLPEGP